MALRIGISDIGSLLAARFTSVADFGLENITPILDRELQAHNQMMLDMITSLCFMTTDRQRLYGAGQGGSMVEVDEYGASPTQRGRGGSTVGFPLRKFQYNVGWTKVWFQRHTPADLAEVVIAAEKAHRQVVVRTIKRAIYTSANTTYIDHLVDNVSLAVKAFVNADSADIPTGPNGEAFVGATHTHYDGEASLTAAFLTALINNVVEHGHGGMVKVAISRTDEAAVRALTGFTAYSDPRLIYVATDSTAQKQDLSRLDNRAIGIFGAAEVWVKPWAIANYIFAYDEAGPNPLAFRQDKSTSMQGLQIAAELDSYPLHAQFMESDFGVGVWERTNGAVLYFANATYADPTIV